MSTYALLMWTIWSEAHQMGVPLRAEVLSVVDCRRHLPNDEHVPGNLVSSSLVPVSPDDGPAGLAASIEMQLRTPRAPLALLAAMMATTRVAVRLRPPPPADPDAREPGLLSVSYAVERGPGASALGAVVSRARPPSPTGVSALVRGPASRPTLTLCWREGAHSVETVEALLAGIARGHGAAPGRLRDGA